MTVPTELDFELVTHTDPLGPSLAQLRRQNLPWPWHIEVGDDFLNWAESVFVERGPEGRVTFRPADTPPAVYAEAHMTISGDRHYDLVEVAGKPVPRRG